MKQLPVITAQVTVVTSTLTLSDYASMIRTEVIDCSDCSGAGCYTCKNSGDVTVDLCGLCGLEEGGCDANCKRTLCCNKHPVDCDCQEGVALYQAAYGIPSATAVVA